MNDPAVSHLEMDDNVPGREHELGRPRHAMSVIGSIKIRGVNLDGATG